MEPLKSSLKKSLMSSNTNLPKVNQQFFFYIGKIQINLVFQHCMFWVRKYTFPNFTSVLESWRLQSQTFFTERPLLDWCPETSVSTYLGLSKSQRISKLYHCIGSKVTEILPFDRFFLGRVCNPQGYPAIFLLSIILFFCKIFLILRKFLRFVGQN